MKFEDEERGLPEALPSPTPQTDRLGATSSSAHGEQDAGSITTPLDQLPRQANGRLRAEVFEPLTREDFLEALDDLDRGVEHPFSDPTTYEVVHEGRRYPPKAVFGLAASRFLSQTVKPSDFSAGENEPCFRILRDRGFEIERITPTNQADLSGFIGPIDGVQVGDHFASYAEMMKAGVHGVSTQGIWSRKGVGVGSIVLNGGYPDDQDHGDVILYTGAGGQNSTTKKQERDQRLDLGQNAVLELNRELGLPVRVIRGWKSEGENSPESGYRYDGLYSVAKSWVGPGSAPDTKSFKMVTFELVRMEDSGTVHKEPEETERSPRTKRSSTNAEANKAVERRAVDVAIAYFQDQLGYDVEDVGVPGSPYDLVAISADEQLRIEVKGRASTTETVDLTHGEVDAACAYDDAVLAVVDGINVQFTEGKFIASGGRLRVWLRWTPKSQDLKPTTFRYSMKGDPDFEQS
ncbi:DUF3883 domain-containing protein [Planctomycetota bacterium]|nr:DUF3883 domain-containing protein [Planctomycetota bacterium]